MKTTQKLFLVALLALTLLSAPLKADDAPAATTEDPTLDAQVAAEIKAANAITRELDQSLHEDDIEHAALRAEIISIHIADRTKIYNYQEILDIAFRYFVEEPLSFVAKHRLQHAKNEHDHEEEPMLANADLVEHYLTHELNGRTELTASEVEGLLNHHKYDDSLGHNQDGLHEALDKYTKDSKDEDEESDDHFDQLDELDNMSVDDDDDEEEGDHVDADDEDSEDGEVDDWEMEDM